MWELFKGEALFDVIGAHHGNVSLLSKIIIACVCLSGATALVMTAISLVSLIATGAPFIVTSKRLTRKIVSLGGIQSGDVVYDLGCGDARFLIEAYKKYGAKAIGIEISPIACGLAKLNVWLKRSDVQIHCANFKKFDFSDADVIFCYLVPHQMVNLGKRFGQLKKGGRIISRRFEIPGRKPVQRVQIKKRFGSESIFIYAT